MIHRIEVILLFEISRRTIPNRRMDALVVVKDFDVLKDAFLGFGTGRIFVQVDQFIFYDTVKGFNASIIEAVAFTAHAADHGVDLKLLLVLMRGVLAAAIRVMQHLAFGPLTAVSLPKRLQYQFLRHALARVPANDLAGVQIHHARQVQPAFFGRQ